MHDKQLTDLKHFVINRLMKDGVHKTVIPSLSLIRESEPTQPIPRVNEPSFCLVLQGQKEMNMGSQHFSYRAGDYIVGAIDLPVIGHVVKATKDLPYVAIKIEFTLGEIFELMDESDQKRTLKGKGRNRAMFVKQINHALLDALTRLTYLLKDPSHITGLAPILKKEIMYWLLDSSHGTMLKQMVIEGSLAYKMKDVITHLLRTYDQPMKVEELANIANVSTSTLHKQFKEVTAMSPIQYQKQLRLNEAKRLLLTETSDIASIAYKVGYESPSQFSREYARLFNNPPSQEMRS
ncbi:AraC family transcriptional regulator N-terminal domain-containing protein [Alkalihalobacillus sp. NPDC078783]